MIEYNSCKIIYLYNNISQKTTAIYNFYICQTSLCLSPFSLTLSSVINTGKDVLELQNDKRSKLKQLLRNTRMDNSPPVLRYFSEEKETSEILAATSNCKDIGSMLIDSRERREVTRALIWRPFAAWWKLFSFSQLFSCYPLYCRQPHPWLSFHRVPKASSSSSLMNVLSIKLDQLVFLPFFICFLCSSFILYFSGVFLFFIIFLLFYFLIFFRSFVRCFAFDFCLSFYLSFYISLICYRLVIRSFFFLHLCSTLFMYISLLFLFYLINSFFLISFFSFRSFVFLYFVSSLISLWSILLFALQQLFDWV